MKKITIEVIEPERKESTVPVNVIKPEQPDVKRVMIGVSNETDD